LCAASPNGSFGACIARAASYQFSFCRRLSATRATLVALFCTVSEVFDVPVYWPILVVYFFVLFALTMRRQIQCVLTVLLVLIADLPLLCPSSSRPSLQYSCLFVSPRRHMIKYKYVPFDIGRKARYGAK
jgi:hypothetical protein